MFRRSLLSHQKAGVIRFKGKGGFIFLTEQVCAQDGPLSFLAGSAKKESCQSDPEKEETFSLPVLNLEVSL